jgi:hypothetical protein
MPVVCIEYPIVYLNSSSFGTGHNHQRVAVFTDSLRHPTISLHLDYRPDDPFDDYTISVAIVPLTMLSGHDTIDLPGHTYEISTNGNWQRRGTEDQVWYSYRQYGKDILDVVTCTLPYDTLIDTCRALARYVTLESV